MGNRDNRRRRLIVNKSLQSRIIFATAWAPGLCLAVTSLLLGIFCARLSNEALQADVELPSVVPIFITSVCFMLIATGYMLFGALKFSHRIAGPMYHINRVLREVQRGNAGSRIHLRKDDFLKELAADVNDFLEWLETAAPELKVASPEEGGEPLEAEAVQEGTEKVDVARQQPALAAAPAEEGDAEA